MRTDAIHLVEHAFGLTVQAAFDTQGRKLIRHHSNCPACGVALSPIWPVREHLGGGFTFITWAKRTKPAFLPDRLADEVRGALGPVSRDDYPASNDRIFA